MGHDLDASFCKTRSDFYMEKTVQVTENHGDEWGFTWYLRWGIYTSIPTWTHSQNSLAADAMGLKIFFHGTSLKLSPKPSQ